MPDILIRGVDAQSLRRLKARAKRNGRSLQSEAKLLLQHAAGYSLPQALEAAAHWRKKLAKDGQKFEDSASLLQEDRNR